MRPGRHGQRWVAGAVGLLAGCGGADVPPKAPFVPNAPKLQAAESVVYRVDDGETLSGIALACNIEGGAAKLASWNGLSDPDLVHAGARLRMPVGTSCPKPVVPAVRPRFQDTAPTCEMRWQRLREGPAGDALERRCSSPISGMTVCWQLHASPGIEIKTSAGQVWVDEELRARSSEEAPVYAVHDLDANGDPEVILTHRVADSLGLAISWFRILVFDSLDKPPVELPWTMYAPEAWVVSPTGGCDVYVVDTTRIEDDPADEPGNYFVGHKYRWTNGAFALTPEPTYPAQRMTDALFQRYNVAEFSMAMLLDGTAEARVP